MNKAIGLIIILLVWAFVSFWIFNHVDAWAGIGFGVVGVIISVNLINKKIKTN